MSRSVIEAKMNPCAVSFVSLGIFGRELDFEHITKGLGVQPTKTMRSSSGGRQKDLWSLSSPISRTEPVNSHLRWIRQTVHPHFGFLRSLTKKAEVRIYCGLNCRGPKCQWSFWPDEMRMFVDLGIPLEVTVLF